MKRNRLGLPVEIWHPNDGRIIVMRFQVVADRSTVYEVAASSVEDAIDKMVSGEGEEVDGMTLRIRAVPLCPTLAHNVMVERDSKSHVWECADCGYVYGDGDVAS